MNFARPQKPIRVKAAGRGPNRKLGRHLVAMGMATTEYFVDDVSKIGRMIVSQVNVSEASFNKIQSRTNHRFDYPIIVTKACPIATANPSLGWIKTLGRGV